MWFDCVPRPLDWQSPYLFRNEADLDATPAEVFEIFADIDEWPRWFADIRRGRWLTGAPHGVGSRREVELNLLSVREEFLAWDPARRYAFTMTGATLPLAHSIVEDYRLEALPDGRARLIWEVRHDLRWMFLPLSPIVRLVFGRMFRVATAGLVAFVKRRRAAA